jgi:hypothetical protein
MSYYSQERVQSLKQSLQRWKIIAVIGWALLFIACVGSGALFLVITSKALLRDKEARMEVEQARMETEQARQRAGDERQRAEQNLQEARRLMEVVRQLPNQAVPKGVDNWQQYEKALQMLEQLRQQMEKAMKEAEELEKRPNGR